MDKFLVVISQPVHSEVVTLLKSKGCEVRVNPVNPQTLEGGWSADQLLENCSNAQALIAFMPDRVNAEFLNKCPSLRIIACALKGYDNFDPAACTSRGVWLTIVPDLLSAPTAELAIALLLGLTRNLREGDQLVRSGKYTGWRPQLYSSFGSIAGKTLGIIGMGRVGQILAQRLSGFELRKIFYIDPVRPLSPELEDLLKVERVSDLQTLLANSDVIMPLVPLTKETHYLLNRTTLKMIKPGSILVNVGRGSVVEETAVAEALASGQLGGYAADVFEMEDWARADRPLNIPQALLENESQTFFTPHLGSALDEVRREIELTAAQNVLQVMEGHLPPKGAVNQLLT